MPSNTKMIVCVMAVLALTSFVVRADLPVHCLKHQITGKWKVSVTQPMLVDSPHQMSCGHDEPDNAENSYMAGQDTFSAYSSFNVQLDEDNTATNTDDVSVDTGKWTMVYDEGFEFSLGNTKYFAFSRYFMDDNLEYKSDCGKTLVGWYHQVGDGMMGCYKAEKSDGSADEVTDNVEQAFVVQPKEYQNDGSSQDENSSDDLSDDNLDLLGDVDSDELFSFDNDDTTWDSGSSHHKKGHKNHNKKDKHHGKHHSHGVLAQVKQEIDEDGNVIDDSYRAINDAYALNPHLADDDRNPQRLEKEKLEKYFENGNEDEWRFPEGGYAPAEGPYVSTKEKRKMKENHDHDAMKKKHHKIEAELLELSRDFKAHHKVVERLNKLVEKNWKAHAYPEFVGLSIQELNKKAGRKKWHSFVQMNSAKAQCKNKDGRFELEDISDLPKQFDWSEYLAEPREQGDCGSCYAFATIHMLETRLRIHHQEDVQLSIQHTLDCSYYNQGCDGGYPFLVEKFASENELVPEECHPYRGSNGKCSTSCDPKSLDKTYKVSDYYFIGGAYGESTERNMMLEIKKNGPIVVSFEPKYDFMHYGGGIYHSVDANDWILNGENKPEWEKVDHSVLCYGWGEENGEKYWKLMNWWGTNWGENGHFRMRRGSDESNIESLAEASMPVIVKKGERFAFAQKKAKQSEEHNRKLRGRWQTNLGCETHNFYENE